MMIGKSIPEYIFIRVVIAALQLVAPLSVLHVALTFLVPLPALLDWPWTPVHSYLLIYTSLEAVFFLCIYLPRRSLLQKAGNDPVLSREERKTLFRRCSETLGSGDYPSGWFLRSRALRKDNILEWLLWALFSTSMDTGCWRAWKDEIVEYVAGIESVLGQPLADGYNRDAACMRLTLDPVRMLHRPLLWYLIVGIVDLVTSVRLYSLGFRHYSDNRLFHSFPPRPLTLLSRPSNIQGLSYWYRPHRSLERNPVLFLHGVGIGLYPYSAFLAELASQHSDIGIVVPEFLSISSRMTTQPLSRHATVAAIRQILDTHSLRHVVITAHSYGTVITAQLWRSPSVSPYIAAAVFVDPIPFLLHLPNVAYNFVYRSPQTANEWLLWYFASRDPDVSCTLSRHFFWAENILWKEDLHDKTVAVALSGQDQVVNTEAVRRYLTGDAGTEAYWRKGRLEVLYYPELDHAMIFHTVERRRRLLRVLDRFVHECGRI